MKKLLACLMTCLLLTGCDVLPYPRELEDTMLVRVLGVDWTATGVTLTASDIPQEGGQEAAALLTAWGESVEASHQKLKETGEEYVALTHVTQVIIGEGSDLRSVLEAALEEKEVGQTATVWLSRDTSAQELMEKVGGGAKRLTSIELNCHGLSPKTVLDALAELEQYGEVSLPLLGQREGVLEPEGMILWKEVRQV